MALFTKVYLIDTKKTNEEIISIIDENTAPIKSSVIKPRASQKEFFTGTIDKSVFNIIPFSQKRKSFIPYINGEIIEKEESNSIKHSSTIHKSIKTFLLQFGVLATVATFFLLIVLKKGFITGLGMPVFFVLFILLEKMYFEKDSKNAIEFLESKIK